MRQHTCVPFISVSRTIGKLFQSLTLSIMFLNSEDVSLLLERKNAHRMFSFEKQFSSQILSVISITEQGFSAIKMSLQLQCTQLYNLPTSQLYGNAAERLVIHRPDRLQIPFGIKEGPKYFLTNFLLGISDSTCTGVYLHVVEIQMRYFKHARGADERFTR